MYILYMSIIVSDKVVAYFDPKKDTEVWVDASPVGLSAILLQYKQDHFIC